MSSLQNRAAKPKSKKKGTSVVSCVEKFLHDGSATPAMKRTFLKELEKLKSKFEPLIDELSPAGGNKAEKIKLNYHYVDTFESIFYIVSNDIKSNLKLIPKRKPGNEEDVKYFSNFSNIVLDKARPFMEFVEKFEEIVNLDPDKCDSNEANKKAEKVLKSARRDIPSLPSVLTPKVCNQEQEVLLVEEDLVGCHTQTT
jgi:hypothetical protein